MFGRMPIETDVIGSHDILILAEGQTRILDYCHAAEDASSIVPSLEVGRLSVESPTATSRKPRSCLAFLEQSRSTHSVLRPALRPYRTALSLQILIPGLADLLSKGRLPHSLPWSSQ